MQRLIIIFISIMVVIYPAAHRVINTTWSLDRSLISNLFPLFGILGFTLLWLHIVGPSIEPWLRKYIDFTAFIENTSTAILIFIVLHPLLLLISFGFDLVEVYQNYSPLYLTIGIVGWMLLLTYDLGRALKRKDFFVRNWNKILLISTIGFLLTFFHSINIGSDLQSGLLRVVWIFYGVTGIISAAYNYGVKPFLKKSNQ